MRRLGWVVALVLGVAAVAGGTISSNSLAQAGSTSYHVNLTGKVVDTTMARFDEASRRHFGVGVKAFNQVAPQLEMDLQFEDAGAAAKVSGSGVIRVGKLSVPITVDPQSTVNSKSTSSGLLYVGSFHSTIHTKAGDTVAGTMLIE